jgi:hypothetical protein
MTPFNPFPTPTRSPPEGVGRRPSRAKRHQKAGVKNTILCAIFDLHVLFGKLLIRDGRTLKRDGQWGFFF